MKEPTNPKTHVTVVTAILLVFGLLGLLVISVSAQFADNLNAWHGVIQGVSIAVITASILGLTVDIFLKKALIHDVFSAAMGYILPPELQPEVRTLYEIPFVCVEHVQTCMFRKSKYEGRVRIHTKIERTLKNVSGSSQPLIPTTAIYEWFLGEPSRIIDIGINYEGQRCDDFKVSFGSDVYGSVINKITGSLIREFKILPGGMCTVWYETVETKRNEDLVYRNYLYPTMNPRVTLAFEQGTLLKEHFAGNVFFNTRAALIVNDGKYTNIESIGESTKRLIGVLSPQQNIELRWWKKEAAIEWSEKLTKQIAEQSRTGSNEL